VQVFGRRDDGLSTRCGGWRPKSAKARNRGKCEAAVPRALWGFRRGLGLVRFGILARAGAVVPAPARESLLSTTAGKP